MLFQLASFALGAALLSSAPLAFALSPSDIPSDIPVSKLVSNAAANLAAGNSQDALTYYEVAIQRDPQNYLTLFKRGAAYLSLGKNSQAGKDFDRVLELKPGFEGALVQRAKLKSRHGDWEAAANDYKAAGKSNSPEVVELQEARGAAILAQEAAEKGEWETCVSNAGIAIVVAGTSLELRKLRARCRFENGDVMEGISDLQHVLNMASGSIEPHLQISAMTFYSLGETEKGLSQIRKCLHSDPDSKACMKLMKREKALGKQVKKARDFMDNRQFNSVTKILTAFGGNPGLLRDVQDDFQKYKKDGHIHAQASEGLYISLLDMACESYVEMKSYKLGRPYCTDILNYNARSLSGLLFKAKRQLDADEFDDAVGTLNEAKEHHPQARKVQEMLHEALTLQKRSKQKDYYKVLGIDRDADERSIKKAYRKLTMKYHPDKASIEGISKEEAQNKMAAINEAYEVLSDPELKARFDAGDDPNEQNTGQPFQGSPFGQGPGGQQFFFRQSGGSGFKFAQGGGFQFPGGDFPF